MKLLATTGLLRIATAKCALAATGAGSNRGALAAIRQAFRLPEAASTTTISGCRSSVSDMTGKKMARTQTIATDSIFLPCFDSIREPLQRNRHTQKAATVMASQIRLRSVSIGPF